jgi:hypothetical protein
VKKVKSPFGLLFLPFFYSLPDFNLSDFGIDAAVDPPEEVHRYGQRRTDLWPTVVAGLEGSSGLLVRGSSWQRADI